MVQSRLLALQPELRNLIYDLLFINESRKHASADLDILTLPTNGYTSYSTITATCRQLRNETLPIQQGHNTAFCESHNFYLDVDCFEVKQDNVYTAIDAAERLLDGCATVPQAAKIRRLDLRMNQDQESAKVVIKVFGPGSVKVLDFWRKHADPIRPYEPGDLQQAVEKGNIKLYAGDDRRSLDVYNIARAICRVFGLVIPARRTLSTG